MKTKYMLFTIVFLLASSCLRAQGQFKKVIRLTGAQGFPQPGVSNANTRGKVPVGLYTGTPNISIPLYEFKLRNNIQLPTNLNYYIYNVEPNNLSSKMGLGWSLECGRCITRIIKNESDISYESSSNEYKPITTEADLLTTAGILVRVSDNYINTRDEYQFNLLGYTGSFIHSQGKSKWMVQSNSDIKTEFASNVYNNTRSQLTSPLSQFYNYCRSEGAGFKNPLSCWLIDSSTLTTPDGYKYIFGGTDKVDYNPPFKGFLNLPAPIIWHLSKIITPAGHKVEFTYEIMSFQVNGSMFFCVSLDTLFWQTAVSYDYELLAPIQLTAIRGVTDNKILARFHYSPSTQLPYGSQYAWKACMGHGPATFFIRKKGFMLNKLDFVVILDRINYQFTYANSSAKWLKLKTLTKATLSGAQSIYSLDYFPSHLPGYNTGHYDNLGFNSGGNFSYYFSKEFFENAVFADKQIAEGKEYTNKGMGDKGGFRVIAEVLKSITYPAHGRTEFIYKPNVVFDMVPTDRRTVQSAHLPHPGTPDYTYPGSLRIKEINNCDSDDELLTRKHYYYTKEFIPTTKGGVSSGVLSFIPQYLWGWQLYNLLKSQNGGPEYYTLNAIISQTSNPLWYNSREEYIGYSKVMKCNEDKNGKLIDGYTIHTFSNFGPDYIGGDPIAVLSNKFSREYPPRVGTPYSPYTPRSSSTLKREMLLSKEQFGCAGHVKQKELFEYTPIQKDSILITEITATNVMDYNSDDPTLGFLGFAFGGTYYQKFYSNLLSEKRTIAYDNNGNTIEYKDKYEYNSVNKQVKLETSEDGTRNVYEEEAWYMPDVLIFPFVPPCNSSYQMNQLHFTGYPLEVTKIKNGKVTENETYFYKLLTADSKSLMKDKVSILGKYADATAYQGLYNVGNELAADVSNIPATTYLAYDSYSNPTHIRNEEDKTETVYLYGYEGGYAIAETKDSDYESVIGLLGNDLIKRLADATRPSYSNMQKVENLRTQLPAPLITTYEYIPYIGINKIRGPKNVSTYFKYDDSGRLIGKTNRRNELVSSYKYSDNL